MFACDVTVHVKIAMLSASKVTWIGASGEWKLRTRTKATWKKKTHLKLGKNEKCEI